MNAAAASLFALLAKTLPRSFRGRYGDDMRGHFEAELRESRDLASRVLYILAAYGDVLATAVRERLATIRGDLIFSRRSIRKNPGFAIVIVVTLALAIGANAAVFGVLRAVVLAPLPYPDSDRIAIVHGTTDGDLYSALSWPDMQDVERAHTAIATFGLSVGYSEAPILRRANRSIAVDQETVSPGFFDVFGLAPEIGRYFRSADARRGAEMTIVLSDQFWRKNFAADPAVVGRMITLSDTRYRVIGVAPAGLSSHDVWQTDSDAWIPITDAFAKQFPRDTRLFQAVVRIAPGRTIAATQRELKRVFATLRARYPVADRNCDVSLTPLLDDVVGPIGPTLFAIFWAVTGLLLIACANVANLMLGRASAREHEVSVRISLGAPRSRIVGQLLTETFVLVAIGGALGIGLAYAAIGLVVNSHADFIPRLDTVSIDRPTLCYTIALVTASTVLAGLVPALLLSRRDINVSLSGGGRSGPMGRGATLRSSLVVFEIACTLALVILGGLAIRNYAALVSAPLGFDANDISVIGPVQTVGSRYQTLTARTGFFRAVRSKVAALPGVADAAWAFNAPFVQTMMIQRFTLPGRPAVRSGVLSASSDFIDPDYFRLLKIPTIAGRTFDARDRDGTARVVVVNQAFVRAFLGGGNILGSQVRFGSFGDEKRSSTALPTIVGVVGDARQSYAQSPAPTIYEPIAQGGPYIAYLLVRRMPVGRPADYTATMLSVDPEMVAPDVTALATLMSQSAVRTRVTMQTLVALATVALALSIAGIFAVVSYGVTLRTHEFGIRMALGSSAARIHRDVVVRAMRVACVGIAAGTLLAAIVVRLVPLSLTTIAPLDPATFTTVIMLMTVATLVAALIPALRATRVDPTVALRSE
jgi:predicted permease